MLVARISASNEPSISLFRKLGFMTTKEANVFGEIEMRFVGGVEGSLDPNAWWGEKGEEIYYPLR
jgi:hypothetical protein